MEIFTIFKYRQAILDKITYMYKQNKLYSLKVRSLVLNTESAVNIMKNALYFTSKALFVLKIFNFSC